MKKRKPFPIFRLLGVGAVGCLFFSFYWFIANALNFWPAYILSFLVVAMCVKAVQTLIEEWRGKIPHTAPDSPLPAPERKITIKHVRDEATSMWRYWVDGPPRVEERDPVPGRALAKLLERLGHPKYDLVSTRIIPITVKQAG